VNRQTAKSKTVSCEKTPTYTRTRGTNKIRFVSADLSEAIDESRQARFIPIGVSWMNQVRGRSAIKKARNGNQFSGGSFLVALTAQVLYSLTKDRSIGSIPIPLFDRCFHPLGARFMTWQVFVLSILSFKNRPSI